MSKYIISADQLTQGTNYTPVTEENQRDKKYTGWQLAVHSVLNSAGRRVK